MKNYRFLTSTQITLTISPTIWVQRSFLKMDWIFELPCYTKNDFHRLSLQCIHFSPLPLHKSFQLPAFCLARFHLWIRQPKSKVERLAALGFPKEMAAQAMSSSFEVYGTVPLCHSQHGSGMVGSTSAKQTPETYPETHLGSIPRNGPPKQTPKQARKTYPTRPPPGLDTAF